MDKLPSSKERTSKAKGGFTLVELSIVLVIIGFLVGGILAAQSMISTAKINATVRQIGQFDAGVGAFTSKFNYLPGDAPIFGGNGDGAIEGCPFPPWCASGGGPTTNFRGEIANFFSNIDSIYATDSNSPAIATGPLKNVPESKMGSTGAFFIASAMSDSGHQTADLTSIANYYAILSGMQAQTQRAGFYIFKPTSSSNSAVKPIDLQALDRKIDDGIANSGNVLSGEIADWGGTGAGSIYSNALASCSIGANYITANSGYECTPLIRLGSSTGDPQ